MMSNDRITIYHQTYHWILNDFLLPNLNSSSNCIQIYYYCHDLNLQNNTYYNLFPFCLLQSLYKRLYLFIFFYTQPAIMSDVMLGCENSYSINSYSHSVYTTNISVFNENVKFFSQKTYFFKCFFVFLVMVATEKIVQLQNR